MSIVATLHMGFQLSGWKSVMDRHSRVLVANLGGGEAATRVAGGGSSECFHFKGIEGQRLEREGGYEGRATML